VRLATGGDQAALGLQQRDDLALRAGAAEQDPESHEYAAPRDKVIPGLGSRAIASQSELVAFYGAAPPRTLRHGTDFVPMLPV
jgi:hypothetical protein